LTSSREAWPSDRRPMGPGTVPKFPSGSQAMGTGKLLKSLHFAPEFPGSQLLARAYDTCARVMREDWIYWELWELGINPSRIERLSGSHRGSQRSAQLGTWEPAGSDLLADQSRRDRIGPFRGFPHRRPGASFRRSPRGLGAIGSSSAELEQLLDQARADLEISATYEGRAGSFGTGHLEPVSQGVDLGRLSGPRRQLGRLSRTARAGRSAAIAGGEGGTPPNARARSVAPSRSRFFEFRVAVPPVRLAEPAQSWTGDRGSGGAAVDRGPDWAGHTGPGVTGALLRSEEGRPNSRKLNRGGARVNA
jgi:hypothetical protein